MFILLEALATFTESFAGFYFLPGVAGRKSGNNRLYALCSLALTIAVTGANMVSLYSGWITAAAFVFMALTALRIEKIRVEDGITIMAFYFILMHLFDFLAMTALGVLKEDSLFPQSVMARFSADRAIFLASSKIGLVGCSLLIRNLVLRLGISFQTNGIFITITTVFLFLMGRETLQRADTELLTVWIAFLGLVSLSFFFASIYMAYRDRLQEQKVMEARNEFLTERIQQLMKAEDEQRRLTHDVRGHLMVIHKWVKEGESQKALDYISSLVAPIHGEPQISWTGNEIVDFILNVYRQKAKEERASMEIDADCTLFSGKQASDLCIVFCNLLENALEAVKKCMEDERSIGVSIRQFGEILFIRVENSMAAKPEKKGGRLMTLKEDAGAHGMGLKNVENTVCAYGGEMSFHYDDRRFVVELFFFHNGEKKWNNKKLKNSRTKNANSRTNPLENKNLW